MRSTLLCFAALFVADGALGFTAMPSASTLRSFQPSLRAVSGPRDHLVGRTALKMELEKIEMVNLKGHTATIYPFGAVVGSYKAPHEVLPGPDALPLARITGEQRIQRSAAENAGRGGGGRGGPARQQSPAAGYWTTTFVEEVEPMLEVFPTRLDASQLISYILNPRP
ncbi:hypothetical protein T484DRAFT_1883000 [Baffinella frigidus]|nr:hypothetical protein T484DRAFT_1883000 [Cryptophyta sp. CCMP2293]